MARSLAACSASMRPPMLLSGKVRSANTSVGALVLRQINVSKQSSERISTPASKRSSSPSSSYARTSNCMIHPVIEEENMNENGYEDVNPLLLHARGHGRPDGPRDGHLAGAAA